MSQAIHSYLLNAILYILKAPIVHLFPNCPPNACLDKLPSLLLL